MSDSSNVSTESSAVPGGMPGLPADWPQKATTALVDNVDVVRTKVTGPAIAISRKIVYGFIAGLVALVAVILVIIFAIRGITELTGDRVWLAYFIIGTLLVVAGAFCWSRRPRGATR